MSRRGVVALRESIVKPISAGTRVGAYAAEVRRRKRGGCPVHIG